MNCVGPPANGPETGLTCWVDGKDVLPITEDVIRIAQVYIDRQVMPRDPEGDALHLEQSRSYHKADYLLTWNCKHLANASKFHHIRLVNYELGLATPILATPLNFGGPEEGLPMSDYEIDQIRRVRHEIWAENGHDLRRVAVCSRRVEEELRASRRFKFADEPKPQAHAESVVAKAV